MESYSSLPDIDPEEPDFGPPLPGTTSARPNGNNHKAKPTDDELRDRWLQLSPMTTYGLGDWRRYEVGVWSVVHDDLIGREVMEVIETAKGEGVRPTASTIRSVMELARLKVAVGDHLWDANHNVVVCRNGILDVRTGKLRPHAPVNYVTSSVPFDYDPSAAAPTWEYFLNATIPDCQEFIQEFAGYCLTGDTRHEIALWLWGPRGSGKSTCQEGFLAMLGEKATNLGLANIERSNFALGNLNGKTLAVASEQPALYIQASHILNALISGEPVTIERKFKDPYTIRPTVKLLWAMNEIPRVPDAGNGLFRRVKVIKFPAMDETERDPRIKEAIKEEGAGILNWAIEGLRRLTKRTRFAIPPSIQDATSDFQRNNDVPAAFVEDQCLAGNKFSIKSSLLYRAYADWCFSNGNKPMSSTSVSNEWERLGYFKDRQNDGMYWQGIGLKVKSV
jgi:putative DNA primase/helicase